MAARIAASVFLLALRLSPLAGTDCADFDDDLAWTPAVCSGYDGDACGDYCVGDCATFCGSGAVSCADGSGAVCALNVLSNLTHFCGLLDAALDLPTTAALAAAVPPPPPAIAINADDDVAAAAEQGCDTHAYCGFCAGSDECAYFTGAAAVYAPGAGLPDNVGAGPRAMALVARLGEVCAARPDVARSSGGEAPGPMFAAAAAERYGAAGRGAAALPLAAALAGMSALVAYGAKRSWQAKDQYVAV